MGSNEGVNGVGGHGGGMGRGVIGWKEWGGEKGGNWGEWEWSANEC